MLLSYKEELDNCDHTVHNYSLPGSTEKKFADHCAKALLLKGLVCIPELSVPDQKWDKEIMWKQKPTMLPSTMFTSTIFLFSLLDFFNKGFIVWYRFLFSQWIGINYSLIRYFQYHYCKYIGAGEGTTQSSQGTTVSLRDLFWYSALGFWSIRWQPWQLIEWDSENGPYTDIFFPLLQKSSLL